MQAEATIAEKEHHEKPLGVYVPPLIRATHETICGQKIFQLRLCGMVELLRLEIVPMSNSHDLMVPIFILGTDM